MMCVLSIHSQSNAVKTSTCTSLFFHIHPPPQPTGNQPLSQVDFCFLFFFLNVKLLTTSFLPERQMVTHSPSHLCIQEGAAPLEWHSANKPWGTGRDPSINMFSLQEIEVFQHFRKMGIFISKLSCPGSYSFNLQLRIHQQSP